MRTSPSSSSNCSSESPRARWSIQTEVSTRIIDDLSPPSWRCLEARCTASQARQPSCSFPLDERFERLLNQRGVLLNTREGSSLREQLIVQGHSRAHRILLKGRESNIASKDAEFGAAASRSRRSQEGLCLHLRLDRLDSLLSRPCLVALANACRHSSVVLQRRPRSALRARAHRSPRWRARRNKRRTDCPLRRTLAPRQVAGPVAEDIYHCQLKPLNFADPAYGPPCFAGAATGLAGGGLAARRLRLVKAGRRPDLETAVHQLQRWAGWRADRSPAEFSGLLKPTTDALMVLRTSRHVAIGLPQLRICPIANHHPVP